MPKKATFDELVEQAVAGCFCPTPRKGKISQTVLIFSAVALPQPP